MCCLKLKKKKKKSIWDTLLSLRNFQDEWLNIYLEILAYAKYLTNHGRVNDAHTYDEVGMYVNQSIQMHTVHT